MKKLLIPILAICLLSSCGEDEKETPKQTMSVDKHGTCIVELNQYNTERYTILTYIHQVHNEYTY